MKIGFTGTQKGLTVLQRAKLRAFLERPWEGIGRYELHHGDCLGADADAHDIAKELNYLLVIHPPTNNKKRAFKKGEITFGVKDYIARNHDIVDACELLIACPASNEEELRSGTWATVRYARKTATEVLIFFPDGLTSNE